MIPRASALLSVLIGMAACAAPPEDSTTADEADHAVVLVLHHVAEDTPPSTSLSPARFEALLELIDRNGFRVVDLGELVTRLGAGRRVPNHAVAITFDDGYRSVFETAWPMLAERGWPFTVFVTPDAVGGGVYMTAEQIESLREAGVTIANHGATHASFPGLDGATRAAEFDGFAARFGSRDGLRSDLFAWPYGEFDAATSAALAQRGWLGFGQQSGAVGVGSDFTATPRYPISARMSDAAVLMRLRSRPLPLQPIMPQDRVVDSDDPAPTLAFTLGEGDFDAGRLGCFTETGAALAISRDSAIRRVTMPDGLEKGRHKTTCTAPHESDTDVVYWYSYLWLYR